MSLTKCAPPEPCLSRGSIVGTDIGVFYASPNGLIQVTNTGVSSNTTELWITREKWAALTPQKNIRAIPFVSCYFAFGTVNGTDTSVAQQGYNIELNTDSTSFSIWPQPGGHKIGFNNMTAPNNQNMINLEIDPWSGLGMTVQNGAVYYWDWEDSAPTIMPYDHLSKTYQQISKRSFAAFRVFFQTTPTSPPVNECPNEAPATDPSWNTLQPNQRLIVKIWADPADENYDGSMQLVTCREVCKSGELLRIESGLKAENWAVEFMGVVNVSNMQLATSVKELQNV